MVEEQQRMEKRHKKASAIDYLFLSGVLAHDLANTEVVNRGRKYDLFSSPEDVARWWNEAIRHHPDREMVKGETEAIVWSTALLEMIKRLRTVIQTLCTNVVEQEPLDPEALAFLNSFLAMAYPSVEVISGNEVVSVYRRCETLQGTILLPIALSAFHLLTQAEKHRLHKCKNDRCILFFYDMTKSATRHWCSLECMNRARSLQHYKLAKEKQALNS